MYDEDIPDISGDNAGEVCTVVLVFISLLAAFSVLVTSFYEPTWGFAIFSISTGLAAIAISILSIGRKIGNSK